MASTEKPEVDKLSGSQSKQRSHAAETELLHQPDNIYHAFEHTVKNDALVCGNREFESQLKARGHLGLFFYRSATCKTYATVPLKMKEYRDGIYETLSASFEHLYRKKGSLLHSETEKSIAQYGEYAATLTHGCVIMTFLKLRQLYLLEPKVMTRFLHRPEVPDAFEIPTPFALAIQLLGWIRISSRTDDLEVRPIMNENEVVNFGLYPKTKWCPAAYAKAVEYAKHIGMPFSAVDLNLKLGSPWWLFDQYEEGETFQLADSPRQLLA